MKTKVFAVSTSVGHNPGDTFVAKGCEHLVRGACARAGIRPVFVPWNRNPDLDAVDPIRGNSLTPGDVEGEVDAIIIAGTPEWTGPRVRPLLEAGEVPVLYMGVGSTGFREFERADAEALKRAALIVTRDDGAAVEAELHDPDAAVHTLPCPSLFASLSTPYNAYSTTRGVFTYQHQNPSEIDAFQGDVGVAERVARAVADGWTIVCHHKCDILDLSNRFFGALKNAFFSYHPDELLAHYAVRPGVPVHSMRLHGALPATVFTSEVEMLGQDVRCTGAWEVFKRFCPDGCPDMSSLHDKWMGLLVPEMEDLA